MNSQMGFVLTLLVANVVFVKIGSIFGCDERREYTMCLELLRFVYYTTAPLGSNSLPLIRRWAAIQPPSPGGVVRQYNRCPAVV